MVRISAFGKSRFVQVATPPGALEGVTGDVELETFELKGAQKMAFARLTPLEFKGSNPQAMSCGTYFVAATVDDAVGAMREEQGCGTHIPKGWDPIRLDERQMLVGHRDIWEGGDKGKATAFKKTYVLLPDSGKPDPTGIFRSGGKFFLAGPETAVQRLFSTKSMLVQTLGQLAMSSQGDVSTVSFHAGNLHMLDEKAEGILLQRSRQHRSKSVAEAEEMVRDSVLHIPPVGTPTDLEF
jgi:hypothetical protein